MVRYCVKLLKASFLFFDQSFTAKSCYGLASRKIHPATRRQHILAGDTLKDFLPLKNEPKDAKELARELLRQKKLTKFQAEEVYMSAEHAFDTKTADVRADISASQAGSDN